MSKDNLTDTFVGIKGRLIQIARRILGDEDTAADAVQEAFCRLWQRRESITSASAAEGLSVVTVRNICIDTLRHNSVYSTVDVDSRSEVAEIEDECGREDDRMALYAEVNQIIESRLSEVQRKIVRMREYEGASFGEIAEELGMTEENVRVNLSRARKMIRETYNKNKSNEEFK